MLIVFVAVPCYAGGNATEYWWNGAIRFDTPVMNFKNVMYVGNDSVTITKLNADTLTLEDLVVNGDFTLGNASSDSGIINATTQFNAGSNWAGTNGISAYLVDTRRGNGDLINGTANMTIAGPGGATIRFKNDNIGETCVMGITTSGRHAIYADSMVIFTYFETEVPTYGMRMPYVKTSTNYTAGNIGMILADASAGAITITLPDTASANGIIYHIKKVDNSANYVQVRGNVPAQSIDNSETLYIQYRNSSANIIQGDTNWWIN